MINDINIRLIRKNGIRIIGDVHADFHGLQYALMTDCFILQLGDLTDYGPDNVSVMKAMHEVVSQKKDYFC